MNDTLVDYWNSLDMPFDEKLEIFYLSGNDDAVTFANTIALKVEECRK